MNLRVIFFLVVISLAAGSSRAQQSVLIRNVFVLDGTGTPVRKAAVRLKGDKILAVGMLKPLRGDRVVEGGGKILAPGFIDTHSHLAGSLDEHPEALAALNQGITTIVSGQDGVSYPLDTLAARMARIPVAINVASYTGQSSLRKQVMGEDLHRAATEVELEKMKELLAVEMQRGSLGLSTGLEYESAYFSSFHEVVELAKVAAQYHGRYISHLRSEDIDLRKAIDEIIAIGREAHLPVQVSHLKLALKDDWSKAQEILAKMDQARAQGVDITADVYPYDFWHSTLKVLFPKTDYDNPASATFAVEHTFDPAGSVLLQFTPEPSYAGKTIAEIAALRKEKTDQTLLALLAMMTAYEKAHPDSSDLDEFMGKSMTEADIITCLKWPHSNICTDGTNGGHPRSYGSYTRVLGRYVRELKIMPLEEAVYKMTGLAAKQVGIKNRGLIRPGYFADLVLFDPEAVRDLATIQHPQALSKGILKVWVNGVEVYTSSKGTGKFPGKLILR